MNTLKAVAAGVIASLVVLAACEAGADRCGPGSSPRCTRSTPMLWAVVSARLRRYRSSDVPWFSQTFGTSAP
ncbi:hypothetical protein [Aeromicrobium sp. CTD01-1L150]|uniref:hypothetical protein n=1 Tax=Aeromicrobium sp. CTD01-1L150 TaxID=3341830 RepID=UPI0035C1547F